MPCARAARTAESATRPAVPKADDHDFGILQEIFLIAHFICLNLLPALQQAEIGLLLIVRFQVDGGQEAPFRRPSAPLVAQSDILCA